MTIKIALVYGILQGVVIGLSNAMFNRIYTCWILCDSNLTDLNDKKKRPTSFLTLTIRSELVNYEHVWAGRPKSPTAPVRVVILCQIKAN